MNSKVKEYLWPTLSLMLITLVVTFALSVVYGMTKDAIAEGAEGAAGEARRAVMADADRFELEEDKLALDTSGTIQSAYAAYSGDNLIGYVYQAVTNGYGGQMTSVVGVDLETLSLTGYRLIAHEETATLGGKAEQPAFYEQFVGKGGPNTEIAVVTDGSAGGEAGKIDSLTGATITSEAVAEAVNKALSVTQMIKDGTTPGEVADPREEARAEVMPEADAFDLNDELLALDQSGDIEAVYEAKKGGELVGYVIEASVQGYSEDAPVIVSVGIDSETLAITGLRIPEHKETKTLGGKAAQPEFYEQFTGLTSDDISTADDVDALTGATITTDAVTGAADSALTLAAAIRDGGTPGEPSDPAADARAAVMPEADAFELSDDLLALDESGNVRAVYEATASGELVGYVIEASAEGYNGPVVSSIGIDPETLTITGLRVIEHDETKSLGGKAEEPEFYEQFNGLGGDTSTLDEIDVITGATYTSEGVAGAADAALALAAKITQEGAGNE